MSAIADSTDGPVEQVKVLFALFPGYNTLDVAGPLEVLSRSLQDSKDKCKSRRSFNWSFVDTRQPARLSAASSSELQLP
jgi:hypothetical protein